MPRCVGIRLLIKINAGTLDTFEIMYNRSFYHTVMGYLQMYAYKILNPLD